MGHISHPYKRRGRQQVFISLSIIICYPVTDLLLMPTFAVIISAHWLPENRPSGRRPLDPRGPNNNPGVFHQHTWTHSIGSLIAFRH